MRPATPWRPRSSTVALKHVAALLALVAALFVPLPAQATVWALQDYFPNFDAADTCALQRDSGINPGNWYAVAEPLSTCIGATSGTCWRRGQNPSRAEGGPGSGYGWDYQTWGTNGKAYYCKQIVAERGPLETGGGPMNREQCAREHPVGSERRGTKKRTFRGTRRPAEFGSDEAKTCRVTGASVGDPGAKSEHVEPGQGSPRLVPLHVRPEDSAAEGGAVNAHHGPHVPRVGLAVVATPALGKDAVLAGEIREVSVIMADLRGFTAFCERVPPDRMHRVLNEYLTAMIDVILRQQGHVQDFIGDGILGVFGAPGHDPDHGWHAALSAVEMQIAIRQLGRRWRREGETAFGLGVALHAGQAFAGEVGSPKQRKYAVVGDPVNTVARLEEVNRNLGTEILMSGEVLALVRDRVDVRPRGSFAVRGRSHTVEVFELLGVVTREGGHRHLPAPVSMDGDANPLKLNRSSTS